MCITTQFTGLACAHTVKLIHKCSMSFQCARTLGLRQHVHLGECPSCLKGNFWPPKTYSNDFTIEKIVETKVPDPDPPKPPTKEDSKAYAQSLLDFVVLWLSTTFDDFTLVEDAFDTEYRDKDFMLEVICDATYCLQCGREGKPVTYGMSVCDLHYREVGETSNTFAEFRREMATEAYLSIFETDMPLGIYDTDMARISARHKAQLLPKYDAVVPLRRDVVGHSWPMLDRDISQRFTKGYCHALDYIEKRRTDARKKKTAFDRTPEFQEEKADLYFSTGGEVFRAAMCMMANDPGVDDSTITHIAEWLTKLMIHPGPEPSIWDEKDPSSSLDFSGYERVMTAWMRLQETPRHCMDILGRRLRARMEGIREAQWKAMNARETVLMTARVELYSSNSTSTQTETETDRDNTLGLLPPDWFCFVCHEANKEEEFGPVIAIRRCGHQLHLHCMVRGVCERPGNNTLCPYCNQAFDNLPNNEAYRSCLRGTSLPVSYDDYSDDSDEEEDDEEDGEENNGWMEGIVLQDEQVMGAIRELRELREMEGVEEQIEAVEGGDVQALGAREQMEGVQEQVEGVEQEVEIVESGNEQVEGGQEPMEGVEEQIKGAEQIEAVEVQAQGAQEQMEGVEEQIEAIQGPDMQVQGAQELIVDGEERKKDEGQQE